MSLVHHIWAEQVTENNMADNKDIVGSIFGVTPEMYQQQRQAAEEAQARTTAQLKPEELVNFYGMRSGQAAGNVLGGLLGVEDPQMQLISRTNQLVQQIGIDTPEKLKTLANELQKLPGGGQLAMQALDKANTMMEAGAKAQTAQQKIDQEKKLRDELNTLGENATDEDVLRVVRKYGTPDQVMKAVQASIDKKNALEMKKALAGDGTGVGPVGKTGAYRNIYGEIIPASEMSKQRVGFQKAEQLLENLNKITLDDISKAESWFDWTSGENKKQFGGKVASETVSAQSKINAAQLLKQIESLPPGSASNADMAAAKSSFPGYGDAKNLEKWVRDTKQTLSDSLARQSEQYGFNQRVMLKDMSTTGKQSTGTTAIGNTKTITLKNGVVVTVEQ